MNVHGAEYILQKFQWQRPFIGVISAVDHMWEVLLLKIFFAYTILFQTVFS